MTNKLLLGKSDIVNFPNWQLKNIQVKIDTGAFRSSIDCSMIKVIKKEKQKTLQFILLNTEIKGYTGQIIETTQFKTSKVKSSNGQVEKRYVVNGVIEFYGQGFTTEFTLSDRNDMKFPVLIGRKLLNHHFIVDTAKNNLSLKYNKRIKKNITF
ncbi:MAG: RimK/LysX family protein [Chitinophagales bacterium]|nr:RimK/LysX family protein [Chitinophagales bacterium]